MEPGVLPRDGEATGLESTRARIGDLDGVPAGIEGVTWGWRSSQNTCGRGMKCNDVPGVLFGDARITWVCCYVKRPHLRPSWRL